MNARATSLIISLRSLVLRAIGSTPEKIQRVLKRRGLKSLVQIVEHAHREPPRFEDVYSARRVRGLTATMIRQRTGRLGQAAGLGLIGTGDAVLPGMQSPVVAA